MMATARYVWMGGIAGLLACGSPPATGGGPATDGGHRVSSSSGSVASGSGGVSSDGGPAGSTSSSSGAGASSLVPPSSGITMASSSSGGGAASGASSGTATPSSGGEASSMGGSSSGGANASAWPPITSGEPLTVPEEQWTWVPFSDTRCGNGTPAGIAVNRSTQSNNVVIYLSGGGACWDAASCFALETSIHFIHGVDENVTLQEAQAISNTFYFNRSEPANPLKDASYVYVPYCTGDLHSGNRSVTYQVFFEQKPGHHVGWTNMRSFLARIGPTFPNAQRVWIAGSSAGGYGAAFHWHHARQVFPNARVDLLNDSAPLINAWEVYGTWRGAWNMQYPEGCTNCRQSFVELFKHAAATAPAGSRQALLTSLQDQTLALYFGVGGPDLEARVRLLLAEYSAASGAHAFVEAGNGHVMLTAPAAHRATDMTELPAWLQAFFSDDANWGAAGY